MGRRIDYYDDPNAPKANSLVPSVNVVVENDNGEILLIRRTDNDNWALPGGAIDLGESVTQAAIRETKEETGIDVKITGLVGIYSDPKHVIHYTSNNEVRQEFSIVLTASPVAGDPVLSDESSAVMWTPALSTGSLRMDRTMRLRLRQYIFERSSTPFIR
ncbi:NUDIX domain-containing protein [Actinomadura sp. KC345]|uniref:NUDIX domain-containing protein n=1 Tax=Actinomadura sp. KC345 TaxID=2530371 RepID=UPI001050F251|nr:NUDIX domain-containing protein [Actinomadura sp. KC345]TDC54830.1 NUDIX domain-containing protein [Actinomadura sp. KC345]